MSVVDQAKETQLKNIQTRTGKSLAQLSSLIRKSGLTKHGEILDMLKRTLGMGYGDANALAHFYLKSSGADASQAQRVTGGDVLAGIYSGPKAELRPIHDKVMEVITKLGQYEVAPKKGYVSLRRKKQFAMLGPASQGRVEVGLNMKDVPATDRLRAQPPGGMCQYKVYLSAPKEVDKELVVWIKRAYDSAG